jgi:aspartyl-tRNA(Asn)/glutamyl-tRNA(Gln) amidotransferase subunit A
MGTTHATENGMNPLGFNPNHPMPRNVYSADHGAGGSSTGAGVAVGLGLTPVASGGDGGGSIRVPAAHNGVFGLKPTFNRISSTGNLWKASVGHGGPLGASAEDLVDFLQVASGLDPEDPFTQFATDWDTVRPTWRNALGRGIAGCRIGVLHREIADADPRIAVMVRDALAALEADGAELVDVHLDRIEVVNAIGPLIIASESAANAATDMALHRRDSSDELRLVYGLMQAVSAPLYLHARRARAGLRLRLAALIADVDVLALPTTQRLAAPYPRGNGRQIADLTWTGAMTRFSFLGNLTGLPALSAPIGRIDGLPVGLQLVGDAWDEASVLAAGAHVQRMGLSELPAPRGYVDLLG